MSDQIEKASRAVVVWQDPVKKEEVAATAPSVVKQPEREMAYVIKDPTFGEFEVYKSAKAWWMDTTKVHRLIDAFKSGHNIKSAIVYTGISRRQWDYFNDEHPDFCRIKEACEEVQMFKAMNTINANLDDPAMARWYMDRRHPKFATKVRVDTEAPSQPTINSNADIGSMVNLNSEEIAAALRELAQAITDDEKEARSLVDEVMQDMAKEVKNV